MDRPLLTRLQSIDVLRGLAALIVVVSHLPHKAAGQAPDPTRPGFWFWLLLEGGSLGVMLFILLSGYCLHANALRETADQPPETFAIRWSRFWRRRFTRLYIPYILVVLISTLGILGLRHVAHVSLPFVDRYFDAGGLPNDRLTADVALHAGLVHNLFDRYEAGLGNGALWSLGMEAQLYVLFVGYLALRRRLGRGGAVGLVFLVSGLGWPLWMAWGPDNPVVGGLALGSKAFHPLRWWFPWVLGSLLAEATAGRLALPRWCADWRAGAGLFLLYVAGHGGLWEGFTGNPKVPAAMADLLGLTGAPAYAFRGGMAAVLLLLCPCSLFVLVNALLRAEGAGGPSARPAVRGLAIVGVFSYSLYLVHMPVLEVFERVFRLGDRFDATAMTLRFAVAVPVCLAAGYVFFQLVEKHFLVGTPRKKAAAPAPAPALLPAARAA